MTCCAPTPGRIACRCTSLRFLHLGRCRRACAAAGGLPCMLPPAALAPAAAAWQRALNRHSTVTDCCMLYITACLDEGHASRTASREAGNNHRRAGKWRPSRPPRVCSRHYGLLMGEHRETVHSCMHGRRMHPSYELMCVCECAVLLCVVHGLLLLEMAPCCSCGRLLQAHRHLCACSCCCCHSQLRRGATAMALLVGTALI